MPWVPFHSKFHALARLDFRVGVHFIISNNNLQHIAQLGPIQVSNLTSFRFDNLGSNCKLPRKTPSHAPSSFPFHFQPPTCLDRRVRVQLEISYQEPNHIVQLGSNSKISQETSMDRHEYIPSYHSIKIFIMCTQPHSCFKLYPTTSYSTHPSNHLYQSPTITPYNHPTPWFFFVLDINHQVVQSLKFNVT